MNQPYVLLLDDDADLRHAVSQGLELEGHEVSVFEDPLAALSTISRDDYAVIVSDIMMPKMDGFDVLTQVMEIDPVLPVILITGHGDVPLAVKAMKSGAYDFIEKPFTVQKLATVVERALEKRRLVLENRSLRETLDEATDLSSRLVGRASSIEALRSQILALSEADVDVLVLGETGTGKEVVARALHDFSSRKDAPFVALNCAALPKDIIESELFGHEAGAFTGANKARVGKLEYANGGTVFLDEIESMPLDVQAKLLRALEDRTIVRLGSNQSIQLDVRFIAATKVDLGESSESGGFRSDLYYRLNVAALQIPPLRDRKEDIPLLFFHLAREARGKFRREIPDVSPALETDLVNYDWPGNVRELRNTADRFVLGLWNGFGGQESIQDSTTGDLATRVQAFEKSVIEREIQSHGGQLKATYESLGLSRKGLYDKMKRLGIQVGDDGSV
jgi:two-component system C4-dicarboxylate transport response regulator DctD